MRLGFIRQIKWQADKAGNVGELPAMIQTQGLLLWRPRGVGWGSGTHRAVIS